MTGKWWTIMLVLTAGAALGWINYDDKVPQGKPEFGKEFAGFSLQVSTKNVEFEQEMPEPITIILKNANDRPTLLPPSGVKGERHYALHLVLADKDGESSIFSRNLIAEGKDVITLGQLPPRAETTLIQVPFDSLEVARVDAYENGMPSFPPGKSMAPAGKLVPQLFTMKVVLLSGVTGKRPDFVVGSNIWRILLKPKSAARMAEAEKQEKLKQFMSKLAEGAYGGVGVSSQLAALGETAVDPLIAMAEKTGHATTRESRIWAIVTLCGTGSPKAQDYILKKLQDPVDFGDLAFLAWHSQGFNSPKVRDALLALARDIVTDQALPWEKKHGRESRFHGAGCLKYIFQHFISAGQPVPDEIAAGALNLDDEETAAFGLMAWKPGSPEKAVQVTKPLFLRPDLSPSMKRTGLGRLQGALADQGFPVCDRAVNADLLWQQAGRWLVEHNSLSRDEFTTFLRCQTLNVKTPPLQQDVIAQLQQHGGADFPVRTPQLTLPDDWVRTWQWALKTGGFKDDLAVRFLCGQMRTTEELPPVIKRALLLELKARLGPEFPLKSAETLNLDEDWDVCGNWLIEQGYFKPPKSKAKPPPETAAPLGAAAKPAPSAAPAGP